MGTEIKRLRAASLPRRRGRQILNIIRIVCTEGGAPAVKQPARVCHTIKSRIMLSRCRLFDGRSCAVPSAWRRCLGIADCIPAMSDLQ